MIEERAVEIPPSWLVEAKRRVRADVEALGPSPEDARPLKGGPDFHVPHGYSAWDEPPSIVTRDGSRARPGTGLACPECGEQFRGARGLLTHQRQAHGGGPHNPSGRTRR